MFKFTFWGEPMLNQLVRLPMWSRALFLILLLSLPTVATAWDEVGIYFDEDYLNYNLNVTQPNTMVTGYLVLNEPNTMAGVAGWELCVDITGPAMFVGWELEGQTINVETPPCFVVGVGDAPLPGGAQVLLATFTMLVTEALPVTLSVEPVYFASIPGEMAYLTNDDPQELRILNSATGMPEVAWINQNVPVAVVDPPHVHFGEVPVGYTEECIVTVSNIGGGSLVLDIEIVGGSGAFQLTNVQGPQVVYGGHSLEIPVIFHPTEVQFYEGIMTLGSGLAPNVMVRGDGRQPHLAWEVVPELIFEETPVGEVAYQDLVISNIGEIAFSIEPTLPDDCTVFSIMNPAPGMVVLPGSEVTLILAFTPEQDGPVSCLLDLGDVVDSVALSGSGYLPVMDYSISTDHLNFPDMAVGMSVLRNIVLTNTGEGIFYLDINLMEPSVEFEIINGQGQGALLPGDGMHITVSFTPSDIGTFGNEVVFGHDLIANVTMTGSGVEANSSCVVTPEILDFGTMILGGLYSQYLTVRNDGNVDLIVAPEVQCPNTTITPGEITLLPGHSQIFTVSHLAQTEGDWDCLITLGQSACSEVTCFGTVESGASWFQDRVGLYFDDDFYMNETDFFNPGILEAHLVLKNPSHPDGISGWECRMEIDGDNWLLVGSEIMGQSINIGESPDFIVGLGEPMPWAENLHLADLHLLMLVTQSEAALHLMPVLDPSIPGEMAYLSADFNDLIPMRPSSGESLVAVINANYVNVQAPAPEVVMHGHLVQLNWDVENNTSNSYLVYRREESGAAEVLFDQPMAAVSGNFSYSDHPVGFAEGTTLHYSYAVLQDGAEVARSPETDIVINGLPAAMTRLLPNVPNPFNPMTEINFEMEQTGQVRVSIYDVSGRLVNTLLHGQMASGPHSQVWQGRDASGRQVPSGAYYVRLETGGRVDHRKIMLLK